MGTIFRKKKKGHFRRLHERGSLTLELPRVHECSAHVRPPRSWHPELNHLADTMLIASASAEPPWARTLPSPACIPSQQQKPTLGPLSHHLLLC